MVTEHKTCHKCGSTHIVKNGSNNSGNLKYKCRNCGFGGVFQTVRKSEEFKEQVVRAAQERSSSRGLARTFGSATKRPCGGLKKAESLPDIVETLLPAKKSDVLELDELWSSVYAKCFKRWVWIALPQNKTDCVLLHRR